MLQLAPASTACDTKATAGGIGFSEGIVGRCGGGGRNQAKCFAPSRSSSTQVKNISKRTSLFYANHPDVQKIVCRILQEAQPTTQPVIPANKKPQALRCKPAHASQVSPEVNEPMHRDRGHQMISGMLSSSHTAAVIVTMHV